MTEPLHRADPEEVKRDAREAGELLQDRIFLKAIIDLRKMWFGKLMGPRLTDGQKLELVAQLQALEAIPLQLSTYVNSQKMAKG